MPSKKNVSHSSVKVLVNVGKNLFYFTLNKILFTCYCYGRFMQPYPGSLATISISLECRREPGITFPRLAYFMNKM